MGIFEISAVLFRGNVVMMNKKKKNGTNEKKGTINPQTVFPNSRT